MDASRVCAVAHHNADLLGNRLLLGGDSHRVDHAGARPEATRSCDGPQQVDCARRSQRSARRHAPSVLGGTNGDRLTRRELWAFMRVRKKWRLLPIIVVMMLVGALLVFAQGSVLAPFIYTIF